MDFGRRTLCAHLLAPVKTWYNGSTQRSAKMKVVTLTALFPQLKGGACYQRGRGTDTNIRAATARAFADMYKHIKGRKTFTEFSVTVTVGDVPDEETNENRDDSA